MIPSSQVGLLFSTFKTFFKGISICKLCLKQENDRTNKEKDIFEVTCWHQSQNSVFTGSNSSMYSISPFEKNEETMKVTQCLTLCNTLYSPWNSPGQNTGVGSLSLFQQIFPTQESNRDLLHCRCIFYQLSYQGRVSVHRSTLYNSQDMEAT